MIYPKNFEDRIGFSQIRKKLIGLCRTNDAKRIASEISFLSNYKKLSELLRITEEMRISISEIVPSKRFPFEFVTEVTLENIIVVLKTEGGHVSIEDALLLRKVILSLENVERFFEEEGQDNKKIYPLLAAKIAGIIGLVNVERELGRIFTQTGEIKDSASAPLKEIRDQLRNIGKNLGSAMQRIITQGVSRGILEPDVTPVVREGRLVLPLQPMYKRALGGIVHGESATGRTVFVEPAEMVELNNRVRELELADQHEILNILQNLTVYLREVKDEIINNIKILIDLDFIHAKALLAKEEDCQLPNISDRPQIEWYHAVNPVLRRTLREQNKEAIPLNLHIDRHSRILIVSGPNAGGKSVLLKTVGLVQYMLQCGLLPPVYSNSHFGIFHDIFLDIGDNQSIDDDLSTYSSHLQTMKTFLQKGNPRSMVLIDEFGAGTEPTIGGAIAEAVLVELNNKKCWGVITTHYRNLKQLGENTPGLVNGSMLFDRNEMRPLFMLSYGNAGSSFALEIARKSGLPLSIISRATEIVGQEYVDSDKYLLDINRDRKYWENKRYDIKIKEKKLDELIEKWEKEAESLRDKRKTLIDEARKEAEQLITQANANIEKTIRDIKKSQAEKESTRSARQELEDFRKKLQKEYQETSILKPKLPNLKKRKKDAAKTKNEVNTIDSIEIGDFVKLDGKGLSGEVLDINEDKATVIFGTAKIVVDVQRLKPSNERKSQKIGFVSELTSQSRQSEAERRKNFKSEIDVRGMRAEEAVRAVTYLIDDAFQYNIFPVRILHGTGTGALKEAIRNYLLSYRSTLEFHDEDVRLGGAGITVVNSR